VDYLTETVCLTGNFCRQFEPVWHKCLLQSISNQRRRKSKPGLAGFMALTVLGRMSRCAAPQLTPSPAQI